MKKTIILLSCLCILFISCFNSGVGETGNSELTGKWKLIETLADPGDGSGTFQPVESEKTIEFRSDGTVVVSNGFLCPVSFQSIPSTGTYSAEELTIKPTNCDSTLKFELSDTNLILRFPCIEPCGEKYVKIR